MPTRNAYDTLGQTTAFVDPLSSYTSNQIAISFTSAAQTSAVLTDVQLSVEDAKAATDGGSFTVALYSDSATTPGTLVATLGTIQDSTLSGSGSTIVDIRLSGSLMMAAGTRYWIVATGSAASQVSLDCELSTSGAGASGEFGFVNGEAVTNATNGAYLARVVEGQGTAGGAGGNGGGAGGTLAHPNGDSGTGNQGGGGGGQGASGGNGGPGNGGSSLFVGQGGAGGSGGSPGFGGPALPTATTIGGNGIGGQEGSPDQGGHGAGGGGGGGGAGGYGAVASTNGTLSVSVSGGSGNLGGTGADDVLNAGAGSGGGGGGGGGGLAFGGTSLSVSSGVTAQGGGGGNGGGGGASVGAGSFGANGGRGGDGGDGIDLTATAAVSVTNAGTLTGSTGGAGGAGGNGSSSGQNGNGGDGGAGIDVTGSLGTSITNSGTISGGAAGAAGTGGSGGSAGTDGAGILGANITITNTGTIAGGGSTGDAIDFTGGSNTLTPDGGTLTGALAIDGTATSLTITTSSGATLANVITGAGSLTTTSGASAPLVLSGASTFSGGTTVSAGTLELLNASTNSATSALGGGGIAVASGAVLDIHSADQNEAQFNVANAISGAGALQFDGPDGAYATLNANTYTGGTTIKSGIVELNDNAALGSGPVTMTGGAIRAINLGRTLANNFSLGGTIGLGAATNISGTITLTANTTLTPCHNAGGSTWSGAVSLGTFTLTTSDSGPDTTGGSWANQTLTISGAMSGSGGLTQDDSGTVLLSGKNTYTGTTTLEGGTLQVTGGSAIADNDAVDIEFSDDFEVLQSETIGSIAGVGTVLISGCTLTAGGDGTSTTYSGTITDDGSNVGSLTKIGAGTLTLTTSNSYSGTTTASGGVLDVQNTGTIGTGGATVSGTGTLKFDNIASAPLSVTKAVTLSGGTLTASNPTISYTVTLHDQVILSAASRIDSDKGVFAIADGVDLQNHALTVGGVGTVNLAAVTDSSTSKAGTLTKDGTGTANLQGIDTYTGLTTVSAGSLDISGGQAIGDSSGVMVGAQGQLIVFDAETVGGITGSGTIGLDGVTLTVGGGGVSSTFDGTIEDLNGNVGTLVKVGAGTLTLTAAQSYSGTTTVNAGTLDIKRSTELQGFSGPGVTVNSGATFEIEADFFTLGAPITLNGGTLYVDDTVPPGNLVENDRVSGTVTLTADSQIKVDSSPGGSCYITAAIQGTGQALTLTGASTIYVQAAIATGAGTLTKTGTGTVFLQSADSYTGKTTVSAGTLDVQNGGALGGGAAGTTVQTGGTLKIDGDGLSVAEPLTMNGGTLDGHDTGSNGNTLTGSVTLTATTEIDSDAGVLTISGAITGAGQTVTFGGAGTVKLAGANNYSGMTTVAGHLAVFQNGTIGALGGGGNVVISGATLTTAGSDIVAFSGVIADASSSAIGSLSVGGGTQTLSGANTYSGTTTVTSTGILDIQNSSALGAATAGTTVQSGGTLKIDGNALSIAEPLTLSGTGVANGGALDDKDSGSAGNTVTGGITLAAAARIDDDTSVAGGFLAVSGSISGTTQNLTLGGAGRETISGVIQTGSGTLTKDGTGTVTLSGANTYTGATTVSSGTLDVQNNNALGTTDGGTTVGSGGTLKIDGDNLFLGEPLTLSGGTLEGSDTGGNGDGVSGPVVLTAASRINSDAAGGYGFFETGTITGTGQALTLGGTGSLYLEAAIQTGAGGTLTKDGTGTATLSLADTYTGLTKVAAGVLQLYNGQTIDDGAVEVDAPGELDLFKSETVGSITGNGTIVLSNATLTDNNNSTTFSGVIKDASASATGGLTKAGAGKLTLAGADTYSGATTVSAGILDIKTGSALGAATAGTTVATGATLEIEGDDLTLNEPLTLSGNGASNLGALDDNDTGGNGNVLKGSITLLAATRIVDSSGAGGFLEIDGTISGTNQTLFLVGAGSIIVDGAIQTGTGALNMDMSGTVQLAGADTYTGTTTVSSGTLQLAGGAAVADTGNVVVNGGTLLLLNSETIGSLAGSGSVALEDSTLITGGNSASTTFSGVISDAFSGSIGSLTKIGTGTLALTGANTYSGGTSVNAGTLSISSDGALGNGGTVTLNGGTLALSAAFLLSHAVTFGTGASTIALASGASIGSTVKAFTVGDTIDLTGLTYKSSFETFFAVTATGGTLRIFDTATDSDTVATVALSGNYGVGVFTLAKDAGTGTKLGFVATPPLGLSPGNAEFANITGSSAIAFINQYNSDNSLNRSYTVTRLANGTYDFHFAGGSSFSGKPYAAFDNIVTAAGLLLSQNQYNSFGKLIQQTQFNANGSVYLQDTVSYASNGNITYHYASGSFFTGKSFAAFDNVTNASGTLLTQTQYNSVGKPIQQTQFNTNASVYLQYTISYASSGNVTDHFAGGSFFNGKSFAAFDNIATAAGLLLTQILYASSGAPTQETFFNADGSVNAQTSSVTKLSNGNYDFHFTTGSFFSANPAVAAFDDINNAAGLLLTQTQVNSSGKAVAIKQFNADGSLYEKDIISYASNGNILNHFANGSFFTGKSFAAFDNVTNSSGLLLNQTLYDASGNATQYTAFNSNGTVYQQAAISQPASGQMLYRYNAGSFFTGKSFSAFDNLSTTGGTLLDQILYNRDGSHTFTVPGSNLTLTAQKTDTFNVTGQTDTTRFNATGFGADTFNGYKAGDIFSFATSIFANYAALQQHLSGTSSAVITTSANDTLTLANVAKSSVTSGMFTFS